MPLLMLVTVCCFYLALLLWGMSVGEAQQSGWLVNIGSTANFLKVLTFTAASEADLGLIALQAGSIATVIVVTAVALLLNSKRTDSLSAVTVKPANVFRAPRQSSQPTEARNPQMTG